MPRYMMYASLIPGKEQPYIDEHDNIYIEVSSGLKKAGVKDLHIWRKGVTKEIFMFINIEEGLGKVTLGENSEYLRSHERVREWKTKMATDFHKGWTEMTEIHTSDKW